MTTTMKQTTFRMTPELEAILEALEAKFGIGRSDIVRIAIRKLADQEGIRVVEPKKKPKKK
jgi:predicted DNA-binding protein